MDTANMYEGYTRYVGSPGGRAEALIGKAIADKRDKYILATKVGMKVGNEPHDEGTSPAAIRKQLDLSLQRLGTDYIDIYYLHRPDESVPLAEILSGMDAVMQTGKVRYYGVSNYSAKQLTELLKTAEEHDLPQPVVHQPPYSLLNRDIEKDLLPLCAKEEIAVVPYQVLQGGLLTGKYRRGQGIPAGSRKAEKDGWGGVGSGEISDAMFDKLEEIESQAKDAGVSMTQYAIHWALEQPAVVSALIDVKRAKQLNEAITVAA